MFHFDWRSCPGFPGHQFANALGYQASSRKKAALMKIHEYQAKEILRKYGVAVPDGETATTLEEAETAAKTLFSAGNKVVVVKAQIHAGGRARVGE
jgi:phosphoribosylamine-glycine ligase